eukprot:gb/GECG01006326.1/.p1 GENE.gb/GECG01006326.1/~~gb/GECG01006326.1/.p1  ORF type:complete len:153 (+),score=6.92 gb/GECG01006326.1/:1-459(+)
MDKSLIRHVQSSTRYGSIMISGRCITGIYDVDMFESTCFSMGNLSELAPGHLNDKSVVDTEEEFWEQFQSSRTYGSFMVIGWWFTVYDLHMCGNTRSVRETFSGHPSVQLHRTYLGRSSWDMPSQAFTWFTNELWTKLLPDVGSTDYWNLQR